MTTQECVYEREFLLQFRDSFTAKPVGMFEVKVPRETKSNSKSRANGANGANPANNANVPRENSSGNSKNWDNYHKNVLKRSETAWTPLAKKTSDEKVLAEIRGHFNKLTDETFDEVFGKITKHSIDSSELLQKFVDVLYQKAILEKKFCYLYAQISMDIQKSKTISCDFLRCLLNKCQKQFETNLSKPKKLYFVGNVRFIAHLHRKGLLGVNIIEKCIKALLHKNDDVAIEVLSVFLTELANKKLYKAFEKQIEKCMNSKHVSTRIKFLMMDVQDFYKK